MPKIGTETPVAAAPPALVLLDALSVAFAPFAVAALGLPLPFPLPVPVARGALEEAVMTLVPDKEDSVRVVDVSIRAGDAENVVSVLSVERLTVLVGTRSSDVVVALRSKASKPPGFVGETGVPGVKVDVDVAAVAAEVHAKRASS